MWVRLIGKAVWVDGFGLVYTITCSAYSGFDVP